MGDIAEMMISGLLCAECGSALEENLISPDCPVLCHDCHSEYQKKCDIPHAGEKNGGIMCERFYL